jgi:dihydroanticapsin dehydrogenase
MFDLSGKTALVTGATSGMGRASVVALLEAGASVVASGRSAEGLAMLPKHPLMVSTPCDVTLEDDVQALVDLADRNFGSLDIVFNVAGMAKEESFIEGGDIWRRTMDTNFNGVVNVCRAVIPVLQKTGGGSIVNWASTNSFEASPRMAAYCVSKAAVLMLTKCLALDYAADGIRVNAVCPGYVDTPMLDRHANQYSSEEEWLESVAAAQPLGMATPESVADVAVFLASNASRMMTGSAVMADGGWTARAASLAPPPPTE